MAGPDLIVTVGVVVAFTIFAAALGYVSWKTHR